MLSSRYIFFSKTARHTMSGMYKIIQRTVLFLFFFLASLVVFYVMGNYQFFLDINQIIILNVSLYASLALLFFSFVQIIFAFIFIFKPNEKKRLRFAFHILFGIFTILCAVLVIFFASSVNYLSDGIRQLHPTGL